MSENEIFNSRETASWLLSGASEITSSGFSYPGGPGEDDLALPSQVIQKPDVRRLSEFVRGKRLRPAEHEDLSSRLSQLAGVYSTTTLPSTEDNSFRPPTESFRSDSIYTKSHADSQSFAETDNISSITINNDNLTRRSCKAPFQTYLTRIAAMSSEISFEPISIMPLPRTGMLSTRHSLDRRNSQSSSVGIRPAFSVRRYPDLRLPVSSVGAFTLWQAPFTLLLPVPEVRGLRQKYRIIATCVSGSAETVGVVGKRDFRVYSMSSIEASKAPRCVGILESSGSFRFVGYGQQLRSQQLLFKGSQRIEFTCAAISDHYLAVGAAQGYLILFGIRDGDRMCGVCHFIDEGHNGIPRKVLFDQEGAELAALFVQYNSGKEIWKFSHVGNLPIPASDTIPPSHRLPLTSEFHLDMVVQVDGNRGSELYTYTTRDAKFSSNGKFVTCTNHIRGTALVSIFRKEDHGRWKVWGRHQIITHSLDNWDENCLGFTGVSLYEIIREISADVATAEKLSRMIHSYSPWTSLITS